jgi:hypothetical protein
MNKNLFRLKLKIAETAFKIWLVAIASHYSIKMLISISMNNNLDAMNWDYPSNIIMSIPLILSLTFYLLCLLSVFKVFAYGDQITSQVKVMSMAQFLKELKEQESKENKDESSNDNQ